MLAADGATPRGGGNRLFFLVMLVMLGAGLYLFWQADGKAGLDNGPAVALAAAPLSADEVETGTHWAEPPDFPTLATLGYDFVITTLHPDDGAFWEATFDAAEAAGLKLSVGLYPEPYRFQNGKWSITAEGKAFLRLAASRASIVKSVFVYNEPYWIHPFTEQENECGAMSAVDLRLLRDAIREVWPQALIHHDLGDPSLWAPGGFYASEYPCLGQKYADQTGVADLVGIWYYPFVQGWYLRERSLAGLQQEIAFVREKMNAEPVVSGQAFRCSDCGEASRLPSAEELEDWNCSVRRLGPQAISWYPWRQDIYEDYLSQHPQLWPATVATPCQPEPTVVLSAVVNSATNALGNVSQEVSEEMIVALYGVNLATETLVAGPPPLPTTLGDTTMTVIDSEAVERDMELYFASSGQVNGTIPAGTALGPGLVRVKNLQTGGSELAADTKGAETQDESFAIEVAAVAPGVFSADASGQGTAAALVIVVKPDQTRMTTPIFDGSLTPIPVVVDGPDLVYLLLFGTGIRGFSSEVRVRVGGEEVPVLAAVAQGQYPGLDQVNAGPLPASLAGRGEVPIEMTVDDIAANVTTLTIN